MILSLDLGSTSFKAAVVDENLQVHGFCARELRHRFAPGGKVDTIQTSIRNDSETSLATWQWRAKVPLIGNESSR